ncbi:uncharacterized protein K452DRAFT_323490 [Aplosporella prunicola CBS 121167]|uniref:Cns1/TTC4 wheel domain-containing protein n=1 Tax=Aplosporella prunicola CBS 121167 TaxID=1176127 RepID=A0A6A6BWY7_9PEZI|nr:uncharacterized protein K452DRAFT_323490 [Aplosporella prunicola CBS 121167]KAF2147364.1 hypothetical protein K452DRAFT_323490 [Aplosporella prunicola CBS 121167]
MAATQATTADELFAELNRTPLFMTQLDASDGAGGENVELEALRALAYEGTRAEVAANFREQGNECARMKQWADAREYYGRAVKALDTARESFEQEGVGAEAEAEVEMELGPGGGERKVVDLEEEDKKEKETREACLVNRALCNLSLRNYRATITDTKAALRLNPANIKAWYRAASAFLALDKTPEAADTCARGLALDEANAPLLALKEKIATRAAALEKAQKAREQREARRRAEEAALALALKARKIRTRETGADPDTADAKISLADPVDAASILSLPVLLLYPLHAQTDLVQACAETDSLGQHLEYILPVPWDEAGEYGRLEEGKVECYLETGAGGIVKAGLKVPLGKVLGGGQVEVVDGLVRVNVVPKSRAGEWIAEVKRRKGL